MASHSILPSTLYPTTPLPPTTHWTPPVAEMHFTLSTAASLLTVGASLAQAAYPASKIPPADVVNAVKDTLGQYALAVDSKSWDFSNFCSSRSWQSDYGANAKTNNLTEFTLGHGKTLPADTISQHVMDVKYVYQLGDKQDEVTARTYVIATVFKKSTNASFADYNVYEDALRIEDGAWKLYSRNATALVRLPQPGGSLVYPGSDADFGQFATGDPNVLGHL